MRSGLGKRRYVAAAEIQAAAQARVAADIKRGVVTPARILQLAAGDDPAAVNALSRQTVQVAPVPVPEVGVKTFVKAFFSSPDASTSAEPTQVSSEPVKLSRAEVLAGFAELEPFFSELNAADVKAVVRSLLDAHKGKTSGRMN